VGCCGSVRRGGAEQHKREDATYGEAKWDSQGARDVKREEWAEHFFRGSEEGGCEADDEAEGSSPHCPLDCASHLAAVPWAVGACGEPKKESRYDGRYGRCEDRAHDRRGGATAADGNAGPRRAKQQCRQSREPDGDDNRAEADERTRGLFGRRNHWR
jgi:hypothetical protein